MSFSTEAGLSLRIADLSGEKVKESLEGIAKGRNSPGDLKISYVLENLNGSTNGEASRVLPEEVHKVLMVVLMNIVNGRPVTVIPSEGELAIEEAAEFLGVSHSDLMDILKKGELKSNGLGEDCRVRVSDLVDYKNTLRAERRELFREMVAYSQKVGEYD